MTDTGKLLLIKLGGAAITHKDRAFSEDLSNIRRLGEEIRDALAEKPIRIILGTGGGSFAHQVADQFNIGIGLYETLDTGNTLRPDALKGFALTQDAAAEINRIVVKEFLKLELPVISMQPSSFLYCDQGEIQEVFLPPLQNLLENGLIPTIYGDIVTDWTKGCTITSTEMELVALARLFHANRLILCTDVDGVFTDDPVANPSAELIPEITPQNFPSLEEFLKGAHATDVTGGMHHKVASLLELTPDGIESYIINGNTPDCLREAILGEQVHGTRIGL